MSRAPEQTVTGGAADQHTAEGTPHARELAARDTIAAIATPPGRGGIGIVRISGPAAVALAQQLLPPGVELQPRRAQLARLQNPDTRAHLDEAVVTWFRAPHSYSGDDVVEIAAHGSPVLLGELLRLMLRAGARLARPGEFTERAFLAGRLDLTQAEAVRDLIDAQTLEQAQIAARQLGGALSRKVEPVKHTLIGLIAQLEAGIDFAEDDTPVIAREALAATLAGIHGELQALEASFERGRLLRDGVRLAIVGRPNAGKSSLFNRLLGRDRSIVTDEPGTTRDTVQERFQLGGVPVELIDTAGLREALNEAERIGIERTREELAEAGLVLLVLDGTQPLNSEETRLMAAASGRRLILAINKSDRIDATAVDIHAVARQTGATPIATSAYTGAGVEALRQSMAAALGGAASVAPEDAMLTSLRQHAAVLAALNAVAAAQAAEGVPHEMLLLDLYAALAELDALTGTTTPDDILHLIFSTFCIGK